MNILHNTKLWLIIIAIGHLGPGTLLPYLSVGNDELAIIGLSAVVGVYLLYAAFMVEGQAQARLAAALCGPMVVWFVLAIAMDLQMYGDSVAPFPEAILPFVLWGMPALSGVMGWNMEESSTSANAEA